MASKNSLNGEVLNLLKQLGLNQYESRIYTSLLSGGSSTAGELAEFSNVPRSRVYDVLNSLEKKGFAIVQVGRPVKYVAVPLETAVSQVRNTFEEEYNKKLNFVAKLEKDLRSALTKHMETRKKPAELEDVVGVLRGKNNLFGHVKHLISDSENRIYNLTNEYGLQNLEKHCKNSIERAKKRGIDYRILANISSLKAAGTLHEHVQLRSHRGIEGRFLIKDGKEIVLVTNPQEDTGLWIKSEYLANTLEKLFEHAWEKGKVLSE